MNVNDIQFMSQFISDGYNGSGIDQEKANAIEALHSKYKKSNVNCGDIVLTIEFGAFGSVSIYDVLSTKDESFLEYKPGSYNYISITALHQYFLFTDYSDTEPYNRQPPFYIGCSFDNLKLINSTGEMRVFNSKKSETNCSFGVWGFYYNDFWNTVRFGICLGKESKDDFLKKFYSIVL